MRCANCNSQLTVRIITPLGKLCAVCYQRLVVASASVIPLEAPTRAPAPAPIRAPKTYFTNARASKPCP